MKKSLVLVACLSMALPYSLLAQEEAPISRAEFNQLKAQLTSEFEAKLKQQRQQFEKELAAAKNEMQPRLAPDNGAGHLHERAFKGNDLEEYLAPVVTSPGTKQLTLTGGASATYLSNKGGSNFEAIFNPIFLWEIDDRIRFEGDVSIFAGNGFSGNNIEVETAELSYAFNEHLTLGAGRFAKPTNYMAMHLRKDWVNKLPTLPELALATFDDGAQLRGELPVGSMLLSYAAFVGRSANSNFYPDYSLGFPNDFARGHSGYFTYGETHNEVEVGGRLGLELVEGLTIGYGVETFKSEIDLHRMENWLTTTYYNDGWWSYSTSEWHSSSSRYRLSARPVIHTVDLNYFKDLAAIRGTLDFHAQWSLWNVNFSDFPSRYHRLLSPYDGSHNGGYAQLAYRPIHLSSCLSNFEPVVRYESSEGVWGHSDKWTFGLDYWLGKRTVIKAAYQLLSHTSPYESDHDLLMLQFATGF